MVDTKEQTGRIWLNKLSNLVLPSKSIMDRVKTSKILILISLITFFFSFVNVCFILYIIKSVQLTRNGFAEGHISVQSDQGLVMDSTVRLNTALVADHVQSIDTKPLTLTSLDKPFVISNHNARLSADRRAIDVVAENFTLLSGGRVVMAITSSFPSRSTPHEDNHRDHISLATETLSANSVSGYKIQQTLRAPSVYGSDDYDLELTSRTSPVHVNSVKDLDVISKAGPVNVETYESLELNAPRVTIKSSKLHLRGSHLRYFDEYPTDETKQASPEQQLEARTLMSLDGWLCHTQ